MAEPMMPSDAMFARLPNRGVLRIGGEDRVRFLQGLVSNDIARSESGHAVYSCLLTPQGKFLHDFFVIPAGDSLLVDCEADRRDDLAKRLSTYRLRAKVSIEDAGYDWSVVAFFGGGAASLLAEGAGEGTVRGFEGGLVFDDPRLPALGSRALLPRSVDEPRLAAGGFAAAPFETYDRMRIALGVPDGSRDMEVGKAILLENNIDLLNGIGWDKGCYIGQELTARTRYRGLVKKRLVPVGIAGTTPEPGSILATDGREIGEMRSSARDIGLALLRLEALRTGAPIPCGDAVLTPRIPAHLGPALAESSEP